MFRVCFLENSSSQNDHIRPQSCHAMKCHVLLLWIPLRPFKVLQIKWFLMSTWFDVSVIKLWNVFFKVPTVISEKSKRNKKCLRLFLNYIICIYKFILNLCNTIDRIYVKKFGLHSFIAHIICKRLAMFEGHFYVLKLQNLCFWA